MQITFTRDLSSAVPGKNDSSAFVRIWLWSIGHADHIYQGPIMCRARKERQPSFRKDLIMIYRPCRSYLPKGSIICSARQERQPSFHKDLIMIYRPCRSYLPEGPIICSARKERQPSFVRIRLWSIGHADHIYQGPIICRARKERQPSFRKDLIMIYRPCRSYLPGTYHLQCSERTDSAAFVRIWLWSIGHADHIYQEPIICSARKERQPSFRKDLIMI